MPKLSMLWTFLYTLKMRTVLYLQEQSDEKPIIQVKQQPKKLQLHHKAGTRDDKDA